MDLERYTQLIIDAKAGKVFGEGDMEYIETILSHIFLVGDSVYKIYKRENEAINKEFVNLADDATRSEFFHDDFTWNHHFNPIVYLKLASIQLDAQGTYTLSDTTNLDDVSELCIVMKRVDASDTLVHRLLAGRVDALDLEEFGYQVAKMTQEYPVKYELPPDTAVHMEQRMQDLDHWMDMSTDPSHREMNTQIMAYMRDYLSTHSDHDTSEYAVTPDNHTGNAVYLDGKYYLIDSYPPKKNWIVSDRLLNPSRIAADALALGSEELSEAVFRGYQKYYGVETIDAEKKRFYLVYSASIIAVYYEVISSTDPSKAEVSDRFYTWLKSVI